MVRRSATIFGDGAEVVVLGQAINSRGLSSRTASRQPGTGLQTALIPEFRKDDVPGDRGHDQQDDQCAAGNEVTLCPESLMPYGFSTAIVSAAFCMISSITKAKRRS
jgi:hypothetical protein